MEPMSTAMLPATKEMMTGEIDASIIATPVGNATSIPTGFTNLGLGLSEKSGNLDANPSPINVSSTATAGANSRAERISLSPSPRNTEVTTTITAVAASAKVNARGAFALRDCLGVTGKVQMVAVAFPS